MKDSQQDLYTLYFSQSRIAGKIGEKLLEYKQYGSLGRNAVQ
jgi:hypothetical protein